MEINTQLIIANEEFYRQNLGDCGKNNTIKELFFTV